MKNFSVMHNWHCHEHQHKNERHWFEQHQERVSSCGFKSCFSAICRIDFVLEP